VSTNLPNSGITFLKTNDLVKTEIFYTQVMRFRLALDQGKCKIFEVCPNCYFGFCLTDGSTGSEEVILTVEMDDVDGFCQYLDDNNIQIEVRPILNEYYKIYQMFIRDPNGYTIEIQRFLDPQWRLK